MLGLGPDPHAQASERAATGLPSTPPNNGHRTRREGEGHWLRNKGLTEQPVTLAFAVGPDQGASDPSLRGGAGASPLTLAVGPA